MYIHIAIYNSNGKISELLLDTTAVHPLPGFNAKHKLTLNETKQKLRAADSDRACIRKKKTYDDDDICAQNYQTHIY